MAHITLAQWVSAADEQHRTGFAVPAAFNYDAATLHDWHTETLNQLEQAMLANYTSATQVPADVTKELQLFVGNGLVHVAGGHWVDLTTLDVDTTAMTNTFGVRFDTTDTYVPCESVVTLPFTLRTGSYWSSQFAADNAPA